MRQLNGFDGHMGEVLPACNARTAQGQSIVESDPKGRTMF
jgi:hypothetical protein